MLRALEPNHDHGPTGSGHGANALGIGCPQLAKDVCYMDFGGGAGIVFHADLPWLAPVGFELWLQEAVAAAQLLARVMAVRLHSLHLGNFPPFREIELEHHWILGHGHGQDILD